MLVTRRKSVGHVGRFTACFGRDTDHVGLTMLVLILTMLVYFSGKEFNLRLTLSDSVGQKLTMLATERDISVAALIGVLVFEFTSRQSMPSPIEPIPTPVFDKRAEARAAWGVADDD